MNFDVKWHTEPFPHAVIDDFLPKEDFKKLQNSLKKRSLKTKKVFETPIENKTIFTNENIGQPALDLIDLLSSKLIKEKFADLFGEDVKILSMGEAKDLGGLSPYHETKFAGFLGSHVDHSSIENHSLRHISNSIFYASDEWSEGWGGETVLFSKNGFKAIKTVAPIPNRLLLFTHSANSFHGVTEYQPKKDVLRKSFYHDYYCAGEDIKMAMQKLNNRHKCRLSHSHHGTIFIPFFPQGLSNFSWKTARSSRHLRYFGHYLIYLFNRTLRVDLKPLFRWIKN